MQRPILKTVMTISGAGLIVLASNEGFQAMPYRDSGGILTDGFGNTRNVIPGRQVSVLSGLTTLKQNVTAEEKAINKCVTVPIYQFEFDALVDAAYNLGSPTVCNSSMVKELNKGNYKQACDAYLLYDKIKYRGQYVSCYDVQYKCKGVIDRRKKQREVCLGQY